MNALAHFAGWIALLLAAAQLTRAVAGRTVAGPGDSNLLYAAAACAGIAVLLHGAATGDPLIAVLALAWLALGGWALAREHRAIRLPSCAGVQRGRAPVARPRLVVLRGGRDAAAGERSGARAGPAGQSRR